MSFNREYISSNLWENQVQFWSSLETWDDANPLSFDRETIILPESWEAQTSGTWATSTDNWDSKQYQGFIRE